MGERARRFDPETAAVLRAAWALCDGTEERGGDESGTTEYAVHAGDWERLSATLDDFEERVGRIYGDREEPSVFELLARMEAPAGAWSDWPDSEWHALLDTVRARAINALHDRSDPIHRVLARLESTDPNDEERRCTCQWASPASGEVDIWPAVLDPRCRVHVGNGLEEKLARLESTGEQEGFPRCHDCGLLYSDRGFADLVVANDVWAAISPTGHEGGLLCPTCMVRRAAMAGLDLPVRAVFRSGPFAVDDDPLLRLRAKFAAELAHMEEPCGDPVLDEAGEKRARQLRADLREIDARLSEKGPRGDGCEVAPPSGTGEQDTRTPGAEGGGNG